MATQVTNYQCPACTGPLHYVGESGMLECDYCGSKYTAAEIESLYAEKEKSAAEAKSADSGWGDEVEDMRAYSCPSCGAELICNATTAATSCPYCGNPTVVPAQFRGTLKPDYIIPFKLGRDAAVAALKRHYKKEATPAARLLRTESPRRGSGRLRPLLAVRRRGRCGRGI